MVGKKNLLEYFGEICRNGLKLVNEKDENKNERWIYTYEYLLNVLFWALLSYDVFICGDWLMKVYTSGRVSLNVLCMWLFDVCSSS